MAARIETIFMPHGVEHQPNPSRVSRWVRFAVPASMVLGLLTLAIVLTDFSSAHSTKVENAENAMIANAQNVDSAIAHGWLPTIIPKSAQSLEESHDLITDRGSFSFQLPPMEFIRFVDKLVASNGTHYHYYDSVTAKTYYFEVDRNSLTIRGWH